MSGFGFPNNGRMAWQFALARDFQPKNSPVSPKKAQNSAWEGGDVLLIPLSIVWSRKKYNVDFHTYIFDVLVWQKKVTAVFSWTPSCISSTVSTVSARLQYVAK